MKKYLPIVIRFVKSYPMALIIAGFVIYHLFIADMSYIDICKNDIKIRNIEREIQQEKSQIARLQEEVNRAESDINAIERTAREKLGMQRQHEDVYLVVEQPTQTKVDNSRRPQSINTKK